MKKHLLTTLIASAIGFFAQAQPNVNNAVPGKGSQYTFNTVSSTFTHQHGGANQNWDFSNLTSSILLTYTVVDADTLIAADKSNFPTCNYATQSYYGGMPLGRDFYESNSTGFYKLGDIGSSPNYNIKSPKELKYVHGMQLNDIVGTGKYDGYGTLKTPYGTFNDVFRTSYGISGDSAFIYYSTLPFVHVLFQYVKTSAGVIQNKYVYNWTKYMTGINTVSIENAWHIYPNPAKDIVVINSSVSENQYQIINGLSQVVISGVVVGSTQVDINTLPAGIYFVRMFDKAGVIIGSKKLVIE